MSEFRVYDHVGPDGYPPEWHATIKHAVRSEADHRCVRCRHPYRNGEHGTGEWSPCDAGCSHEGPGMERGIAVYEGLQQAHWRILTVHHLNGDKSDCRWWNLAALCQRCHLTIQGKVQLERLYPWEHSDWFKPYAAGYYASVYLGEELDREQVVARMDELLALERVA